jgi:hypothetical protein
MKLRLRRSFWITQASRRVRFQSWISNSRLELQNEAVKPAPFPHAFFNKSSKLTQSSAEGSRVHSPAVGRTFSRLGRTVFDQPRRNGLPGPGGLRLPRQVVRRHQWIVEPLYAWLLGATMFAVRPSRALEFPVAHAVNFLIFVAALVCFEFLLRSLSQDLRLKAPQEGSTWALSERSLYALGYAIFLWTSLDVITIWTLSPDLLVSALLYLSAGLLLRLRCEGSTRLAIGLGLTLGFACLAKSVMFPSGFFAIFLALLITPQKKRLSVLLATTICFMAVCTPWVAALSRVKGRFTFGDPGLINYSSLASPGGRVIPLAGRSSSERQARPPHAVDSRESCDLRVRISGCGHLSSIV